MKKPLKKIPKTAELMWVLGIFLVALGVTMSKKADLGVSMIAAPTFIVYEAFGAYRIRKHEPARPYFDWGNTESIATCQKRRKML